MKTLEIGGRPFALNFIFLVSFSYMVPFVDAINGFTILSGGMLEGRAGSIGQIFKLFFLVTGWFLIANARLKVLLFGMYFLLVEMTPIVFHNNLGYFLIGIAYAFKIIFAAVIYFLTVDMFKQYGVLKVLRVFRNSAVLYSLLFFLSMILGLSYATYEEGNFGSKGFFASGNALSIYFGSMSLIGLYLYFLSSKRFDLFLSIILAVAALFVGTKTSIVFVSLYAALLFYYAHYYYKLLLLSIFMISLTTLYELFAVFFDVIIYRFEKADSISSFLASNRDVFVADALSVFYYEGFYILRLIFGFGVYMSFRKIGDDLSLYDTLETDFFDVFFYYGFIGLFAYLAFYFYHTYRAVQLKNPVVLLIFSSIFLVSALIGHVLSDAMAIIPLALSAALTTFSFRRSSEKNSFCSFVK